MQGGCTPCKQVRRKHQSSPSTTDLKPSSKRQNKTMDFADNSPANMMFILKGLSEKMDNLLKNQEVLDNGMTAFKQDLLSTLDKKCEEVKTKLEVQINENADKIKTLGEQMPNIHRPEDTVGRYLREQLDRERYLRLVQGDRQEQYSRRESIRIFGIKEVTEDTETEDSLGLAVIAAIKETGVLIDKADISVFHRLGVRQQNSTKPRSVIVKLVRRDKKKEILSSKKILKGKQTVINNPLFAGRLLMYEDLTRVRRRLLETARRQPCVDFAFTRDGTITCRLKSGDWTRVEQPDDLFNVGVDYVDYSEYF